MRLDDFIPFAIIAAFAGSVLLAISWMVGCQEEAQRIEAEKYRMQAEKGQRIGHDTFVTYVVTPTVR